MKDNGLTALSRKTDVAIFALPIIVTSEEVCNPQINPGVDASLRVNAAMKREL